MQNRSFQFAFQRSVIVKNIYSLGETTENCLCRLFKINAFEHGTTYIPICNRPDQDVITLYHQLDLKGRVINYLNSLPN